MNVQLYTLYNGMRVYMCVMDDEPRIQTFIATRAGSKNDSADATGLAHYLEHMLFKGSSKIAALDWKKEKKILDKISALYENIEMRPQRIDHQSTKRSIPYHLLQQKW